MFTNAFQWIVFFSALGAGLIAGVFFAFSAFVMKALAKLEPVRAVEAMQSINRVVVNPLFLAAFVGTGIGCAAAALLSYTQGGLPVAAWVWPGAACYLFGTFAVTMGVNVPLNNALAHLTPHEPSTAKYWGRYVTQWSKWNHVRTLAALLTLAAFIMALRISYVPPASQPTATDATQSP